MKVAILLNIPLKDYEEMTPYELNLVAEAHAEMMESKSVEQMTLVWLGEYYHRMKKLPSLKKEVEKMTGKSQHKAMTDDEMLKVAERLNKQFGGKVK